MIHWNDLAWQYQAMVLPRHKIPAAAFSGHFYICIHFTAQHMLAARRASQRLSQAAAPLRWSRAFAAAAAQPNNAFAHCIDTLSVEGKLCSSD